MDLKSLLWYGVLTKITAASQEQATGIEQTNKAIMQMDETTQQNAALVEESASVCQSLAAQATRLIQLMESFKMRDGLVAEMTAIEEQTEDNPAAGHTGSGRPMVGAATRRMPTATHNFGAKPATHAAVRKLAAKKAEERKDPGGVTAGNGIERGRKEDNFEKL